MARRLRLLFAALLATLALAPGQSAADAQNGVGAFLSAAPTCSPAATTEKSCRHTGSKLGSARVAAGCCVATKGAGESGVIFRGGTQTENALTDKGTGLSFRDSLSNPNDGGPGVLRPGEKYFGVDTAKLPKGSVIRDGVPPGHVTVRGLTPNQISQAIVDPFGDPFLGGKFPKR